MNKDSTPFISRQKLAFAATAENKRDKAEQAIEMPVAQGKRKDL